MKLIRKELEKVNNKIDEALFGEYSILKDILNYPIENRGKQLRVILGILAGKAINTDEDLNCFQINFLSSIELIHNATLIHDDVIDNAQIRRDRQSLYKKYGNKLAILAGDYYLSAALKLVLNIENEKLKEAFSSSIKELIEGELTQDLSLFKIPSFEQYIDTIRRKTALLFELACFGVCLLSNGVNEEICQNLRQFGLNLGIGFQITDDLNNFKIYENKPVQNDFENGIMTLPIILLTQNDEKLKKDIENKKYDFSEVLKLLKNSDCFEKAEKIALSYINKAENSLSEIKNSCYKDKMLELSYTISK